MVSESFPWVALVTSERNLGFGRAVNLVAERSEEPWIAPANADVALTPGALEALLEAGRAHPEAGAVAPRLLLPDGSTQHSVHAFPSLSLTLLFALGLYRLRPGLGERLCLPGRWDPQRPRQVPWALGAFLLIRRHAFEAAGRFDIRQWLYAEDLDLGWRLARAGFTTRYEPRARVLHQGAAATAQAFGDERTSRFTAASYAWMLERHGALRTRLIALVSLAGAAGRLVALSALALVRPERRAARNAARTWLRAHREGLRSGAALRDRR
jgi:GT2 family glycosyltransferase